MKKTLVGLILIISLFASKYGYTQNNIKSVKDSITIFYDSLFYQLESKYLFRKNVNWQNVKPFILKEALKSNSLEESFKSCQTLFDTINGYHLNLFSPNAYFAGKPEKGKELGPSDFSSDFREKYDKGPGFEVKLLENEYGYIMIPPMLLINISQDSINRKAQQMYDEIMKIHKKTPLKGWILDLRFNSGGNIFPMANALYHFLGDNTITAVRDSEQTITELHILKKGAYYENEIIKSEIKTTIEPQTKLPIALIIGKITASAGEMIAINFRGRKNVILIGEESFGMLTGNELTELPFDTRITLTVGYLSDRKGIYTKSIIPEVKVIKQSNFNDLIKDENIIEAIKFIDSKQ